MTEALNPPPGPDLLTDPLFTIMDKDGETVTLPLPDLLARLLTGEEVATFPDIAAEQRGYVWRFFVRCAAKALHEIGSVAGQGPGELARAIERTLRTLTPEGAWLLYQPNPAWSGFLQISTPDGNPPGAANNYSLRSPSLLTSTIGGKNHEKKSDVARELLPEQAVYALIEYQLSAIFGGRGNYETQLLGSRSGAGSGVPFMGARIGGSNRATFQHDVRVVLDQWRNVADETGLKGSLWALWAEPWDGKSQLGSERLDPAFIPVARMVRLGLPENGLFQTVWFRPTDAGRVRDHTGGGVLGDPFTPLVPDPKTGSPKVRGTMRDGYSYREVVRLLFGDDSLGGTRSPSVDTLVSLADQGRTDVQVVFEGTAYEQGKTGGFHRREVLLPAYARRRIRHAAPIRAAHGVMLQRVQDAKKALRGSARILLNGELKPRQGDEGKTGGPVAELDRRVDAVYLEHLFGAAERKEEQSGDNWIQPWLDWLAAETMQVFHATRGMLPTTTSRRYEREIQAESYLGYKMWELRGGPRGQSADQEPPQVDEEAENLVEEEIG